MKKQIIMILLIIYILTQFTGCWSRREVEDLAITAAFGFDLIEINGKQKWQVTVQVIRPQGIGKRDSSGGGGGLQVNPVWIESAIGDTINDAMRNFSTRSSRKVFLAHSKLIVIGEKAARHGVHEFLDYLQRHKDIRLRDWLVAYEGEAKELLEVRPSLETLSSEEIVGMFTLSMPEVSKAYVVDLKDFLNTVSSAGADPVATRIIVNKLGENEIPEDELMFKGENKVARLHGASVFRGDKLVGFLGDFETMGLLWVNGFMRRGVLPLKMPKHKKMDVSIRLTKNSREIRPYLDDGKIIIKIKIKSEGDLGEHTYTHKVIPELPIFEKIYADKIKQHIHAVIKKAQSESFRADIFHFGEYVHRKYPKEWREKYEKNWSEEHFPKVKVVLDVKVKIRRTGMITNSIEIK